jgi:hypothetical protein
MGSSKSGSIGNRAGTVISNGHVEILFLVDESLG